MSIVCAVMFSCIHAAPVNKPTVPATAVVCAACHGDHGHSPSIEWPNLAGQHSDYLLKQLQDLRGGITRSSAIMQPMLESLSEQTLRELAVFYSKQPLEQAPANKINPRGLELYLHGDRLKHIPACIACHGPGGLGNSAAGFPVLSGQNQGYTLIQLLAFKQKTRHNDLRGIMQDITANMTTEDMSAVAEYLSELHLLNETK